MKAFFSHSSEDKNLVLEVYNALERDSVWLDRAEIDWGDEFLKRIEEGLKAASDFVLFWSASAAESGWVRHELSMAFILALKSKAIRLKIVRLDHTELPLRLEPYQYLSVADSSHPVEEIVPQLRRVLSQPTQGVRHRFLNRNSELERIEEMINNPDIRVVLLHGFQGIGKGALATEALRRFFEGASVSELAAGSGTGPVELALQLHYKAFGTVLPETTEGKALAAVEQAIGAIVRRGQFVLLRECQHWFDSDGQAEEPLKTVIRLARSLDVTVRRPVFLTATRRPRIPFELAKHVSTFHVRGLANNHAAALVSLWLDLSAGTALDVEAAKKVAAEVHGHPVAAKLAANLVAQYGVDHLLSYPKELIALRRDLAKTLIHDLSLGENTTALMETLATIGTPIPQMVLTRAVGVGEEEFQDAVAEATVTGIAEATDSGNLTVHPLIKDYFWRTQSRPNDYRARAEAVATEVHGYLRSLSTESATFVALLPAVFRLYVLAGKLTEANEIRKDLSGELASAAITHYNRRNYDLSQTFIRRVLDGDPNNWRMRQYLARIHVRRERWDDADDLIGALLSERPRDVVSRHLRGWRMLRSQDYGDALRIFTDVLTDRGDHIASLRDAADCLYRLGRSAEALELLDRGKKVESNNPYTLDLEARIYEEMGDFDRALIAARLGVSRDRTRWALRHRLARILDNLGRREEAIQDAQEAVRLDPAQFLSRSTLVSLLVDAGLLDEAEKNLEELGTLATDRRERNIFEHLKASLTFRKGDLEEALVLVEKQISLKVNLAANYGLLARICLAQYSLAGDPELATSQLHLQRARVAVERCESEADHRKDVVISLKERIETLSG